MTNPDRWYLDLLHETFTRVAGGVPKDWEDLVDGLESVIEAERAEAVEDALANGIGERTW